MTNEGDFEWKFKAKDNTENYRQRNQTGHYPPHPSRKNDVRRERPGERKNFRSGGNLPWKLVSQDGRWKRIHCKARVVRHVLIKYGVHPLVKEDQTIL